MKKLKITAYTSTRDRHHSTLSFCILSILHQTRLPDELIIFDDTDYSEEKWKGKSPDLREDWLWKNIFGMMNIKLNGNWKYIFGAGKGQVLNHEKALRDSDSDLIWRIDDDNFVEPNVCETLANYFEEDTEEKIGAVGQNVFHPNRELTVAPAFAKNKMTKGINHQVIEWFLIPDGQDREAEHLYSTYMYRRKAGLLAGGYPMDLSPVGHHEETIFSHKIFRAGYKLIVTPKCKIWHIRNPQGGIRDYKMHWLWKKDQETQDKYMEQWGYNDKPTKIIIANSGIGDSYSLKSVLPDIVAKFKDTHEIVIASNHCEIFNDVELQVIPLRDYEMFTGRKFDDKNIYQFMNRPENQKLRLNEAYRKYYCEGYDEED